MRDTDSSLELGMTDDNNFTFPAFSRWGENSERKPEGEVGKRLNQGFPNSYKNMKLERRQV
jgi:hypothetical protein